ncbi:efflux transporter outer membrane subunit [Bdellovibrio svalbardensis]|uniref:Efflux transporter outer membrane subunit n=1 Tax=Bdellovibrio svalbardensis TaxID=2972972 RepID=A0ABT6DLR4_9BACT|nr:efflux transporter outer membrane subunit [Bdellovibrio svalbardensis]MDG0817815.1 efflux transporter outer membrane subunit [Bdellovibrio svalbardensis]
MRLKLLNIYLGAVLSACAVGPDYKRPDSAVPSTIPSMQSAELEQREKIDIGWWKLFNDPQLDEMVKQAFAHNLDLELALARVDEARASLGIAKADFFPSLDLGGRGGKFKISENAGFATPTGSKTFTDYTLGLNLSYELDLWGKIRRSNEAARAQLFQADFNRANVQLTVVSQVVTTYFLLRSLDLQLTIAQETLASRKGSYELEAKRFKGGMTSELTAKQSEAEMHSAAATVAQLENSVSRAESALSILLGRDGRGIFESPVLRGKSMRDFIVPPKLPMVLPSQLLERRPDIASAEQQLIAANARIGLAKSFYFPSFSLVGGIGGESTEFNNLFKGPSQTWSYGLNLAMPIFNAGKTGFLVDAATARQKEALVQYQKAIQVAFTEVRDALKSYDSGRAVFEAQKAQVNAVERNLYLANLRYKNGQSPYLDVLDAERQLFQVQLGLVQSQQARLVSVVDLYKALGGGWSLNNQEEQK